MKIQEDMIVGEINDPINKSKIKIYFHKGLFAINCSSFDTCLAFFLFF